MARRQKNNPVLEQVLALMESGSRVLGLRLSFHDLIGRSGLPRNWQQHDNPACMAVKAEHQRECALFCGVKVEREAASLPKGRVHVCPFGHTDIVAPVWCGGVLAGVLYASACWVGEAEPPRPGLVIPPSMQWLDDRHIILQALAKQLGILLEGEQQNISDRSEMIIQYLSERLGEAVTLPELATALNLSPSRTGHLVRERFQKTFPQLLTQLRVTRAARELGLTDLPINQIALDLGFHDQSHFTRAFFRHYKMTPGAYRKNHRPPTV